MHRCTFSKLILLDLLTAGSLTLLHNRVHFCTCTCALMKLTHLSFYLEPTFGESFEIFHEQILNEIPLYFHCWCDMFHAKEHLSIPHNFAIAM